MRRALERAEAIKSSSGSQTITTKCMRFKWKKWRKKKQFLVCVCVSVCGFVCTYAASNKEYKLSVKMEDERELRERKEKNARKKRTPNGGEEKKSFLFTKYVERRRGPENICWYTHCTHSHIPYTHTGERSRCRATTTFARKWSEINEFAEPIWCLPIRTTFNLSAKNKPVSS